MTDIQRYELRHDPELPILSYNMFSSWYVQDLWLEGEPGGCHFCKTKQEAEDLFKELQKEELIEC